MEPEEELEVYLAQSKQRFWNRLYADVLLAAILIPLAYLGAVIYLGWFIMNEIKVEMDFHDKYGANWREVYEKYHGPLSRGQFKMAVCAAAILAIGAILIWFYRQRALEKPLGLRRE